MQLWKDLSWFMKYKNSDTTYRIYDLTDWLMETRELHIDKALDVIDFERDVEITTDVGRKKILLVQEQRKRNLSEESISA